MMKCNFYLFPLLIFALFGCSKDKEHRIGTTVLDLAGTWEMPDIGSFTIGSEDLFFPNQGITSLTIDYRDMICNMNGITYHFELFTNPNLNGNKIANAQASDGALNDPGFTNFDLRRVVFNCDFMSLSDAKGSIIMSLRPSAASDDWCDHTFNFTAQKKE